MTTERSNLLSLDRMVDEKSVRVAVYSRALSAPFSKESDLEAIAQAFFDFVGSDGWRMEALDAVLKHTNRHSTLAGVIKKAEAIASWVSQEPELVVVESVEEFIPPTPATPVVTRATTTTRKKKVTRKTT